MSSNSDRLLTILLVEDHLPDAVLIRRSLNRGGDGSLIIEHVSDLAAGLERLSSGGIDLVLLDLSLPDSSGVETLQSVCDHSPQVPIVVLTGLDDPTVGVEMVKAGAQDFIVKNDIDDRLMVRSINYAIERKQIQESVTRLADEQAILAEIGRLISSSIEFESVFQLFAQQLLMLVSFDRIILSLVDDEQANLTNTYDSGSSQQDKLLPLDGSANEQVIKQGKTVILQESELGDPSLFPGFEQDYLFFLRTFLSVPLTSDAKIIGALQLFSNSPQYFSEQDVSLIEKVATQISGAVANSKLLAERKRLEEQLLQSQKMEAVGKLAGGIAHDFNNLLTPILGFSEMMLDSDVIDDWSRQKLQDIHGSATRATDLVHQLLAFSRKEIIEMQTLDLSQIIMDIEIMIRRLIGEDIDLEILSPDDLWYVIMDPTQVQQVIINLVVNSRDAMPSGGRLTISIRNVTEFGENADGSGQSTIKFVELAVTDSGAGISPEDKSRIFDPFFTTKEVGRGTGLGLSTCYGIVSNSNGTIEVDSEVGKGTTFRIKLPATLDAAPALPSQSGDQSENRGTETLLLAEDEELVREVAVYILRQQGYTVLEAHDGFHAIDLIKEHGAEPIHALITDVVMPKMSGRELAKQFVVLHPGAKVLYTSGYTDEIAIKHEISIEKVQFIKKPFTPGLLAQKVRAILDS